MKTSLTLIPGVENRRLGRALGDTGEERIVRSFHFRVRSVKCGGRGTARTRIAYVRREGKHAKSSGDVESAAGHKDALIDAADRVEATSRIKRGPTAERILQSFVLELPAESTAAERAATAEAVVEHWRTRYGEDRPGHEAIAVVHMHGDESPQPHLHVEVAARPILADGTVDRSVRLWTDPSPSEAVKAERAAMAGIVNAWCTTEAAFHGGTFKEIGREDEGKPRLPISAWRAMRKAMRDAGDKDEAARIEAAAYAVEDRRREGLRETGTARAGEIAALKEAGAWPPKSQRQQLKEERERNKALVLEREAAVRAARTEEQDKAGKAVAGLEKERDLADARAGEAGTSAAALGTELATAKGALTAAKNEVAGLAEQQVQPIVLTDAQRPMLADVSDRHGIEGNLDNDARAQLRAFAALHEEREERRQKEAEQRGAAVAPPELVERAANAEAERDALASGFGLPGPSLLACGGGRRRRRRARSARPGPLSPTRWRTTPSRSGGTGSPLRGGWSTNWPTKGRRRRPR